MSLALIGWPLLAVGLSFCRIRSVELLCFNMFLLVVLASLNYYEVVLLGSVKHVQILSGFIPSGYQWSGQLIVEKFSLDVYLDFYSSHMVWLVSFVSFMVHLYSTVYMKDDPRINLFMTYLTVFTLFMIFFVVSLNYVQLFIGWEGIGIASYLLVNFWQTRPAANKSALKALIVNRFGDYFFLFGILLLLANNHSCSVVEPATVGYWTGLFFVLAACAKSAQLGLHTWLADAMEGPTPVSALIHAATMVTAGIFLLIRLGVGLQEIQPFLLLIGGLTTVYAGLSALFQSDLKRVIAYSTCAQLGYMMAALGAGGQSLSFYHLINHAYFKALLFLAAGLVIHSLNNEQDLRRMGGLYQVLPLVYVCFLVGSLSLGGLPFFSGYYSKDGILEVVYAKNEFFVYFCLLFGAYLTVLYSWRSIAMAFWGRPNGPRPVYDSVHEVDFRSGLVLVSLFVFSVVNGYLTRDVFIGLGQTSEWLTFNLESEFYPPLWVKLLPLSTGLLAVAVGTLNLGFASYGWYSFFAKRLGVDIVDGYLTREFVRFCYYFYAYIERGWLEILGATGLARLTWSVYRRIYMPGWFSYFFAFIGLALVFFSLLNLPGVMLGVYCLSYNKN